MRIVHVAVGVIVGDDGKIFIAKRPDKVHQGGLWEFPGGKVDEGETIQQALVRELREELAIEVISSEPLIKIRHDYGDKIVLLDVWKITKFTGEPIGNEGQPVLWVSPKNLHQFEFPAANKPIITAITLPQRWLITGDANSVEEYLQRTESALKAGLRLVQLRVKNPLDANFAKLANLIAELCKSYSAQLQLNTSVEHFASLEEFPLHVGLHLNSKNLIALKERPLDKNILLSASCHNENEIKHAQTIGVDFMCLSPVSLTNSHPEALILGWGNFTTLVTHSVIPAFALGGMREEDLPKSLESGAQGIAAISEWWNL